MRGLSAQWLSACPYRPILWADVRPIFDNNLLLNANESFTVCMTVCLPLSGSAIDSVAVNKTHCLFVWLSVGYHLIWHSLDCLSFRFYDNYLFCYRMQINWNKSESKSNETDIGLRLMATKWSRRSGFICGYVSVCPMLGVSCVRCVSCLSISTLVLSNEFQCRS